MSVASRLLAKIHARGIQASVSDAGKIVLRGPEQQITPKLRKYITRHRSELLRLLTSERPSAAPQSPTDQSERETSEGCYQVTFGSRQLPFEIWDGQQLSNSIVGIDTETHPIVGNEVPRLVVASVSDGERHFVVARGRLSEFIEQHSNCHFVAHNMAFDFWVIAEWLGDQSEVWWRLADEGRLHCTSLFEQLTRLAKRDEPPREWTLEILSKQHLKVSLFGKDDERRVQYDQIEDSPIDAWHPWFLQYAVQDAIAAFLVYQPQHELAKKLQPEEDGLLPQASKRFGLLSETLQVRGAIALEQISRVGMRLDPEGVQHAKKQIEDEIFQLAENLERHAPVVCRYKQEKSITDANRGFKLTDSGYPRLHSDEVRKIFEHIAKENGLQPPRTASDGKISLTKDFWSDYRDLSSIIDLYMEFTEKGKLLSFFQQLDGAHIQPTYKSIVRSGRVSCREPNIQQMPRSGNIREMFVPSPGHVLFAIDFAALELRTLAAVCLKKYGKSALADVINQGVDPHAYSYCQINGMTAEEFDQWKHRAPEEAKAARDQIKGITFGVPGSMQPPGLVRYVKKSYGQVITEEQAKETKEKLTNEVYPEWNQYLAQSGSKVATLTGRLRGGIQRIGQLFNTQFQGLAGDGAKQCLWNLMRAGYRVVGFIHDEFLIELPIADDYSKDAAKIDKICCETMQEFTPGVAIACEYAVATVWSKKATAVWEDGKLKAWSPSPPRPARVTSTPLPAQPLKYHGGKGADHGKLAKWIIRLMPPHIHFVELFAGGLAVLFNKNPEGHSELINDIWGELSNFYRVLQDAEKFERLRELVQLTLFARDEFDLAMQDCAELDEVERARRLWERNRQSRQGLMRDFATPSRSRTRRGMAEPVSSRLGAMDGLPEVHARLELVQVENMDAIELIRREDKPHVHMYLDPTYLLETRSAKNVYEFEMTDDQHQELLETLAGVEHATWQLSGYPSLMYGNWAAEHGFHRREFIIDNKASSKKQKKRKTECVWMNYDPNGLENAGDDQA